MHEKTHSAGCENFKRTIKALHSYLARHRHAAAMPACPAANACAEKHNDSALCIMMLHNDRYFFSFLFPPRSAGREEKD